MQVKLTKAANKDLDNIEVYIYQANPKAAKEVVLTIISKIKTILAINPRIGRPGRIIGTREYIIKGLPYIIPYRVKSGILEVIRVLHEKRIYPKK